MKYMTKVDIPLNPNKQTKLKFWTSLWAFYIGPIPVTISMNPYLLSSIDKHHHVNGFTQGRIFFNFGKATGLSEENFEQTAYILHL